MYSISLRTGRMKQRTPLTFSLRVFLDTSDRLQTCISLPTTYWANLAMSKNQTLAAECRILVAIIMSMLVRARFPRLSRLWHTGGTLTGPLLSRGPSFPPPSPQLPRRRVADNMTPHVQSSVDSRDVCHFRQYILTVKCTRAGFSRAHACTPRAWPAAYKRCTTSACRSVRTMPMTGGSLFQLRTCWSMSTTPNQKMAVFGSACGAKDGVGERCPPQD